MTVFGYIVIISIILLLVGYGTSKVLLCLPAYLCLIGCCIYLFIIYHDNIIALLLYGIVIVILFIPFVIVIMESIKVTKEKLKKNRK